MVHDINSSRAQPAPVRAAMAHLNLAMIHPFSDGNGRMARCLQTLVLASDGLISPEFSSIEEYLGRNTPAYYAVLAAVGQGRWQPDRSARQWLEFCLTAHFHQAQTLLRRVRETEALWDKCEQLASRHALPMRCVGALSDGARGWRLRRALYIKVVRSAADEEITPATATRDLLAISRAGLFDAEGERRGRQYVPSAKLREVFSSIRERRPARTTQGPYEPAREQQLWEE